MATAGHMVTMTGVLFFYFMIFNSHKEKKTAKSLFSVIPRNNKRVLYYLNKILILRAVKKANITAPTKDTRATILRNCAINKEFEFFQTVV